MNKTSLFFLVIISVFFVQSYGNSPFPLISEKDIYKTIIPALPLETHENSLVMLHLFEQSASEEKNIETIFDHESVESLEIFRGTRHQNINLINKICNTKTHAGRTALHYFIATANTDINRLTKRQAFTRRILLDQEISDAIFETLEKIGEVENDVLSFWKNTSLNQANQYFSTSFILKELLPESFAKKLDQNATALEILSRGDIVWKTYGILLSVDYITFYLTKVLKAPLEYAKKFAQAIFPTTDAWPTSIDAFFKNQRKNNIVVKDTINKLIEVIMFKRVCSNTIDSFKEVKRLQERLIKLIKFLNATTSLYEIVEKDPELKAAIENIEKVEQTLSKTGSVSNLIKKLQNLLSSSTFKDKSSHFSRVGTTLAANKIMHLIKNNLIDLLKFIGTADVLSSCAHNIKKAVDTNAQYCFAQYSTQPNPLCKLEEFWCPFIDQDIVVTNNLSLGQTKGPQNAVITGPNAGGKSTILRATMINIILAQSLGITTAKKMILTPFSYLDTYANITDDISTGRSQYKAEVLKTKDMLEKIENSDNTSFGFVTFDELFHGTNPQEGEAAAFSIGKHIAGKLNTLCLISSHYTGLTSLPKETNNAFTNFHVSLLPSKSGTIKYDFRLLPGAIKHRVGIEMLKIENFEPQIIKTANDYLEQNTT